MEGVIPMTKRVGSGFSTLVFWLCVLTVGLALTHMVTREFYVPGHPLRLLVTTLLLVSFAGFIFVYAKMLSNMDEYARQIQLFALAIGFPLSLVLVWGIGYFRAEGLLQGADPRDLPAVMLASYAVGFGVAWLKYR
jgi:hypothetical protein